MRHFRPSRVTQSGRRTGVAVVGLLPRELRRIEEVLPADEVPGPEASGRGRGEEVFRVAPREEGLILGRIEPGEVVVHESFIVGFIGRDAVGVPVGVVEREVEEGTADEPREMGQGFFAGPLLIEGGDRPGEDLVREAVPDLHWMAGFAEAPPQREEAAGKVLEHLKARVVGKLRRPDPGDAQGRFPPALGGFPGKRFRGDAGAGADDVSRRLGAEFERQPRLDGEEVQGDVLDPKVVSRGHG